MSKFLDFLVDNPVDDIKVTEIISDRLKGFPCTFSVMGSDQNAAYRKAATRMDIKRQDVDFNSSLYDKKIIINHSIEPNFKDAAAIKKAGCQKPEQFVDRSLLAGEQEAYAKLIREHSGFKSMDELVIEAKNSSEVEAAETLAMPSSASSD